MQTKTHTLFGDYPLNGEREISVGRVPTPYQTYDGHGLLVGGTANLKQVKLLLQDESVHPIQTQSGHAVMGIWVVDFTDASLGPHTELQISFLVAHQLTGPIEDHPLTLLKALFANPQARMFCYGLWNNTETVVAYNREVLGLDAHLATSHTERTHQQKHFRFLDTTDISIFTGHVHKTNRTSLKVAWRMFRLIGFRDTMRALSQPYLAAKVVNPIGDVIPYNGDAQSYVASDTLVVQYFDPTTDEIVFGDPWMQDLQFTPQFVEHFAPFRFVYLEPQKQIK